MRNKNIFIVCCFIGVILFSIGYLSFSENLKVIEKKSSTNEINKSDIKKDFYKQMYDSVQKAYFLLEMKKQKIKTVYVPGKDRIKYITKEKIEKYTDTICKKDVVSLKDQLFICDSLVNIQDIQLLQSKQQLDLSNKIILENEKQIHLYKKIKPSHKPLGIGLHAGYGTDFKNGFTPYIGIGISYNLVML